ncbi:TPA: LysR family transcriptional regulator [Escherichia coli]|nr:LysR family transcriptional regulator [Escherichia coli]
MLKTTLEQWELLDLVVREGSFQAAAQESCRSQSSVSYNLSLLQERTGIMLLQAKGRRSVLTPAGEILLSHVRPLLQAFSELELKAGQMSGRMAPRLSLYVDCVFPRNILFSVIKEFGRIYPSTQIKLYEVTDGEVPGEDADICILTNRMLQGKRGEWVMDVEFTGVAHCEHPLSEIDYIDDNLLCRYPQIRISGQTLGYLQSGLAEQYFFSSIDAAVEAVICQLGYAWLPTHRIREYLQAGRLTPLKLQHGAKRVTPLHVILRDGVLKIHPQINMLKKLLIQQCKVFPREL